MRKIIVAAIAGTAAWVAVALPVAAGAPQHQTIHYTEQVTGAQISSTQAVFKIHDSFAGNGAGVQNIKVGTTNASGTSGTSTTIAYYGNATGSAKGPFHLSAPNAQGISTITGSGKSTGSTGKLKGYKTTFTVTGTFNTKTLVYQASVTGTATK